MRRVGPGTPEPLGVTLHGDGANVAVFSAHATRVDVCLFDATGTQEIERIALPERTGDVHHGYLHWMKDGTRYGLRAHGPWAPHDGHRFNPAKLLVDPYARALDRAFVMHQALLGQRPDGSRDESDSAQWVPKAIVTPQVIVPSAGAARALHIAAPRTPWRDTVIYELHVRGFTKLHPDIPERLRGTCAALAHPAALAHLTRLGVTAIELMPVAAAIDEPHLLPHGLSNYWGYNTIGWMVPDPRLAPGGMSELRAMVDVLHAHGIEVILDIVLNHSGEGDETGPTVSLRGLDNASYYRLLPTDRSRYINDTGTGNTLALDRPPVLRLALDTLRYYASVANVDGFRFDLGTTLGRRDHGFDPEAPLLRAIAEDPQLRHLKMIAEPWDIGPGGHQLGRFPDGWAEWNDRFRDGVRRFWRGHGEGLGELATRIAGSPDVFSPRRSPTSALNFVTAHDGFTLKDLVSYAHKHNEANGEKNRDGTDANQSWNHGVEGPTHDAAIIARRRGDVRALLATLLLSRGTPMLSMGDELGRTQHGNNNAYAQDNATSWIDWSTADASLIDFTAALIRARREHPALHGERWLTGAAASAGAADSAADSTPDVEWRRPDGSPMTPHDWTSGSVRTLIAALCEGDDRVVVAMHAAAEPIDIVLPALEGGRRWTRALETGTSQTLAPRSVALFVATPTSDTLQP
ncbi:MAG: glycogen debranching protein GlgX [Gemmatimonadaceae bacterium]|nr:glycogen debranching protein GlgX [Gemmatimonadaceae bacterium]